MSAQSFWLYLSIITGVLSSMFVTLPAFANCQGIAWIFLGMFTLLSIAMYYFGKNAALSNNKNLFINLIMLFVLAKMLLSIIILFIYNKQIKPTEKTFLIPFFIAYFCYTIFETVFMMQLGKLKHQD